MSNKQTVMSHDPLAEVSGHDAGEAPEQVPDVLEKSASASEDTGPPGGDLVLESSLTIADVGDYHAVLGASLEGGGPIRIDAGGLDAIDGAGLQLLAAFVKSADAKALGVTWVAVSESLSAAARRLGVTESLRLAESPLNG